MNETAGVHGTAHHRAAADYRAAREVPRAGLAAWQQAIGHETGLRAGQYVVDVGAGTGGFAAAFHDWFGATVLAVEPAAAMRSLIPAGPGVLPLGGTAEALPLNDGFAHAAWLASVLHHLGDIPAAARELRRVLRPGAPVLIRNTFPGHCQDDIRVRYFPETAHTIETYPTVEHVSAVFAAAGFPRAVLHSVPQRNAPSLAAYAQQLHRSSDSKLSALSDHAFARGMAALLADAGARPREPATSWMNLLVLR